MRAIGGHWSHAGGWSVSRRHASLKYARNAEWWSEETHGETWGGGFEEASPLRSATRLGPLARSLGADWATTGTSNARSKVSDWAMPDAVRHTEGERDRLPNKVASDLPSSLPPSLPFSRSGCVPVLWHTTSLSLWTLQRPHLTLQCVWEFIREFKS